MSFSLPTNNLETFIYTYIYIDGIYMNIPCSLYGVECGLPNASDLYGFPPRYHSLRGLCFHRLQLFYKPSWLPSDSFFAVCHRNHGPCCSMCFLIPIVTTVTLQFANSYINPSPGTIFWAPILPSFSASPALELGNHHALRSVVQRIFWFPSFPAKDSEVFLGLWVMIPSRISHGCFNTKIFSSRTPGLEWFGISHGIPHGNFHMLDLRPQPTACAWGDRRDRLRERVMCVFLVTKYVLV
jgi:hypothetical protein